MNNALATIVAKVTGLSSSEINVSLRPPQEQKPGPLAPFFRWFNRSFERATGGYMGLSFAIPIEVAMDVAEQLKTKGRVTRGWLGVLIQDVTHDLAESFGMDHPRGALVAKVLPDSPARAAGLQAGDVIAEIDIRVVVVFQHDIIVVFRGDLFLGDLLRFVGCDAAGRLAGFEVDHFAGIGAHDRVAAEIVESAPCGRANALGAPFFLGHRRSFHCERA